MIVFDLMCAGREDRFEAWFRSSDDFDEQRASGLIECPMCGSTDIAKAPMAPSVPRKGSPPLIERIADAQAEMLKQSRWVGRDFAQTARAMHAGEIEQSPVHGEATRAEAVSLVEDGIPVAPLPLPIVPPNQVN